MWWHLGIAPLRSSKAGSLLWQHPAHHVRARGGCHHLQESWEQRCASLAALVLSLEEGQQKLVWFWDVKEKSSRWFQDTPSPSVNFFTHIIQATTLQKKTKQNCAHQGLCLATSTCKCKARHSTFAARAFQMQIGSHWTGFTSCGVQCTQPPTQKWEWHRKL